MVKMDRYKFRGKRLDNGEWAGGHYLTQRTNDDIKHMISYQDMWGFHEVDQSTVGQYTGLKDKNGIEIYEGDITKGYDWFDSHNVVRWDEKQACFWGVVNCIVIGTIHDNPELMEGK